ncbi:MAG: ester cyclase [Acetobacteraceae bacterium]|nr:ester cyclase [Pseudomonadota bacterium]
MTQQTLLHRWFDEVWNHGRESAVDEMMADDAVAHGITGPDGQPVKGPAAFKAFHRQFNNAFSEVRVTIEDVVCEGEKVTVRCHVTARHTGDGMAGPASGKLVTFGGICLARVRDGKILEAWNHFDFLGMFQQVGMKLG